MLDLPLTADPKLGKGTGELFYWPALNLDVNSFDSQK